MKVELLATAKLGSTRLKALLLKYEAFLQLSALFARPDKA